MVRIGRRPIPVSALLLVLTLAATPTSAATRGVTSAQPQAVPADLWGWVVARQPSTIAYTPLAKDQGNSTGGTNTVERQSAGVYTVHYPGLVGAGETGISLVSALTTQPRYCVVGSNGGEVGGATTVVSCFNAAGSPADTPFVVNRLIYQQPAGHAAYLFDTHPSATDWTPAASDQFNSTNASNTVHRISTGRYQVNLLNLGTSHGNVQITTWGNATTTAGIVSTASACHTLGWAAFHSSLQVQIACRKRSGALADTYFFLYFSQSEGLKGPGVGPVAYLDANQPTTASYTPTAGRRWSSAAMPSHVTRSGVGRYLVTLPGMPLGGGAQVTPYGPGTAHCSISSIRGSTPQQVGVRCFKPSGAPVDSQFGLSYAR